MLHRHWCLLFPPRESRSQLANHWQSMHSSWLSFHRDGQVVLKCAFPTKIAKIGWFLVAMHTAPVPFPQNLHSSDIGWLDVWCLILELSLHGRTTSIAAFCLVCDGGWWWSRITVWKVWVKISSRNINRLWCPSSKRMGLSLDGIRVSPTISMPKLPYWAKPQENRQVWMAFMLPQHCLARQIPR